MSESSDFEDNVLVIKPKALSLYPISTLASVDDKPASYFGAECSTCSIPPPKYPITLEFSYYANLIAEFTEFLGSSIPFISGGVVAVGLASSFNVSIELIKCF